MIVCLGTTPTVQRTMTFERLALDQVNRASNVHDHASGKSINVARILQALGDEVLATGFVGRGPRSEFLLEDLNRAKLQNHFLRVEPDMRLCTTLIDEKTSQVTELVEEASPLPTEYFEQLISRLATLSENAAIVVLSGSLPRAAPVDFYARCLQALHKSAQVILDAVGPPLMQAIEFRPLIVKPNQSELASTLDKPIDSENALRDAIKILIDRGAQSVAITQGKNGAIVSDGRQFWRLSSPSVKAINPIGSGDAFAAGLASAFAKGQSLVDAAKLAIACGAANAMTRYAGHVQKQVALSLLEKIRVEDFA